MVVKSFDIGIILTWVLLKWFLFVLPWKLAVGIPVHNDRQDYVLVVLE